MYKSGDAVCAIVKTSDHVADRADHVAKGFRTISGLAAFRKYNWMTGVRGLNAVGNYRGLVVSARWGLIYNVANKGAETIGRIAMVASLASNLVETAPEFEMVYHSTRSPGAKALEYAHLSTIVVEKTLAGTITGGVHLVYKSLILGCGYAAKSSLGATVTGPAAVCSEVVKNADSLVKTWSEYVFDPTIQKAIFLRVVNVALPGAY